MLSISMSSAFSATALASALSLGATLVFTACDRIETTPIAPVHNADSEAQGGPGSAYDKDIMSLKQQGLDREELGAAIRAVQARHGLVPEAAVEVKAPVTPAIQALQKESFVGLQVVKRFEFELPFAMEKDFVVKPNKVLDAWTARSPNSTVDPYVVAFYSTDAAQPAGRYTFHLAAANDDQVAGNLDSRFSWKNTTGVNQTVRIMAFAYDGNTGGRATLVVLNDNSPWNASGIMRGQIQYRNNVGGGVPAGCSPTGKDRISLTRQAGGGFGNGVIAVNLATGKGGYILESSVGFQYLNLLDVINSGASNGFLMGFTLDQNELVYEYTRFKTDQSHVLTCN